MEKEFLSHELRNQFTKLGFDFEEVHANGVMQLKKGLYQMILAEPVKDPAIEANMIGFLFTIRLDDVNTPNLEMIYSSLISGTQLQTGNIIVEKTFSTTENQLLNKEQIINELKDMQQVKIIRNRFGFNEKRSNDQHKDETKRKHRL